MELHDMSVSGTDSSSLLTITDDPVRSVIEAALDTIFCISLRSCELGAGSRLELAQRGLLDDARNRAV